MHHSAENAACEPPESFKTAFCLSQVLSRSCIQTRAEHGRDERCGSYTQSCRVQSTRAKGQLSGDIAEKLVESKSKDDPWHHFIKRF